jgi:hypothetical protein
MADTPEIEGLRAKARRAAIWASLGAASGLATWGLFLAAESTLGQEQEELVMYIVPGLIFGFAVGLALYRLGHARVWQVALLAAVSVVAWYIAINTAINTGVDLAWRWPSASYGLAASVGGLVWSAILTAAIAILFPFARRPRLWVELLLAGGATAGLVTEALLFDSLFYLVLWTVWYAVYAAVLSTALPSRKPDLPEAGQ